MVAALTEAEVAAVQQLAERYHPPKEHADEIVARVAELFGVTPDEIKSRRRELWLVDARASIAVVLSARNWTPACIAEVINRDRAQVYNLIKRAKRLPELQALADELVAA